jgi:phytoene synthase
MSPEQYCREKVHRAGSIQYYSFLFVPEERQRAITALHALSRELHDVANERLEPQVARAKLAWWRQQIRSVYHGQPQHPVARELAAIVQCYPLEEARLDELIDGVAMDLEYNAYPDFEALNVYCRRVAGVVATLSAEILGYEDRRTPEYAATLGLAVQLTNIVRNVGGDARRNRIYLPLHELAQFGVTTDDIARARESESMRKLLESQIARARGYYDDAFSNLPAVDRRSQCSLLVMGAIGSKLLDEVERNACEVLRYRVELTPIRMLWIAWRTRALECRAR